MKIIDLTQIMHADMPVFPGTEKPIFYPANTLEKDGFIETKMSLYSHTGTHIDAPGHMLEGGNLLNQLEINHFVGKATLLDFTNLEKQEISIEDVIQYEDRLKDVDYVLLYTGWSKYWGKDKYFDGFPYLTIEAAAWLTGFKLKGIGVDTISVDDMKTTTFPVHYKIFENNIIAIENLTNLHLIKEDIFVFSCLPLNYENADGSPVRAIAMENIG